MFSQRKAAKGFIFVTLLLDITGWGIIIPVVPDLIMELTGSGTAEAAWYGGWLAFAYAGMQFICAPVVGALSDQYGRRPVLLASLFGFGLDYVLLVFAPTIGWLFIGRVIAGMMGASFTTASAYIADISTPETRAQNFGIVGAAFGLGFIIGPAIGGLLAPWGLRVPFIACAVLTLINWLYGYFILPESLSLENRRKFEWKRANAFASIKRLNKYPVIGGLILSLVLLYISAHAVQTNWSYYGIERFDWDPEMIGWSLAVIGVAFALVQGVLIRFIIPKLGKERSVYVGLGLYSLGFVLFSMATQTWMMFAFTVVYCLGGIAGPALQGIISTQVPANEQGELQGALTSLMSVTTVIGPIIMTSTFFYFAERGTEHYMPGAPMLLGAFLTVISTLLARRSLKRSMMAVAVKSPD